ncbi:MAG: hypothetical protein H0W87_00675 [Actinobacteria bacterium]|nr:hypothetical protein [Actinomycetota bacterium]
MADQAQREQESRETAEDKFHELSDRESDERERLASELKEVEPEEDE